MSHPTPDLQPTLENSLVKLRPLTEGDFEALFSLASDPLVWAQHPNPNRYKREVFENYFKGRVESGSALIVEDPATRQVIGTSSFYDFDPEDRSIVIGYTFFGRQFWGGKYNPAVKALMLEHAFRFVDKVYFHIGALNRRSQIAIGRIGATKLREESIAYYGETPNLNFVFVLRKEDWIRSPS